MKRTNLFAKLGLATMCAFGTVTPVMSMMAPIHAHADDMGEGYSVQEMDETKTCKTDVKVYEYANPKSKVFYTLKAGTQVHVDGVTDNGYYRIAVKYPDGGEGSGYIEENRMMGETTQTMVTFVEKGFLALRSAPEFKDSNIIGKLFNDCRVEVIGQPDGNYVMVRVVEASKKTNQDLVGKTGYVDVRHLI